jgi:hypothetical protein
LGRVSVVPGSYLVRDLKTGENGRFLPKKYPINSSANYNHKLYISISIPL